MVKRPTTPEAPDDEPRYLTVVHPYPLNGVMEDPKDQRRLVLWLACCTGKDDLFSFFHKPSAPGMIVIEVNRYFDGFDRLLGEHKWSQFLTSPTEEEADRVSRVYYCTLNTGRKVEKTGWKRVNIPEHWFYGWHPNNKHIAYPYPPTSYCPVPDEIEDKTNFALCRRLPAQSFPPPAPPRAPPPGSAQWHDAKSKGLLPTAAAFKSNGAWNKGPPKRAAAASPSPIAVPTPPMSVRSASNSSNPWTRGLPSRSASPLTPALSASSYGSPALSSPVLQTPQVPPGLDVQRERKFSWSEDVERSEAESESVQFDLGPYGYQDALRAPSRAWSGEDSEDGCSSAGTSGPRTIATAMADLSFGVDGPMPRTELVSTEGDEEEQTDLWKDVQDGGAAWTGYADPKEDKILPWKWDCPEHGIKCSKGICQLRGKQEKEAKWAAETAKRQAEKEAREIARSKKAQKKARKENGGGDDGWNNVPRRGSGPRSNSGGSSELSAQRTCLELRLFCSRVLLSRFRRAGGTSLAHQHRQRHRCAG
ncbi:hypothetical protein FA95DRAFT_1566505 [Auriscalpium vulgare]|uniref:Uncharacterized protein n=1 Tax=Auriscalpium vulgare TaxID=40419 RepID=A0ACB8R8B2_9AGAM|nr:hypothetical protein FA95DRAFT_1566505 [Auriscalpium vulgare]